MKSPVKALLLDNLELLKKSVIYLEYSFNHCKLIGIKTDYTMPELNEFEALSGRFSRSSDILTQKVLKTLFIYLQEDAVFFIDRCNLAEKMGLIESADDLFNIRQLRNKISHEYSDAEISNILEPLLNYSVLLLTIIENTNQHIITLTSE
jgi:hypothetical protein